MFAWPGLGSTIVSAIQMKDYPLAQATVLVYGALVLHHQHHRRLDPRRARPAHDRGGRLMRAVRRILRTPLGIAAVTLMTLVVLTAIFAPIIWGDAGGCRRHRTICSRRRRAAHPIGTDHLGRDLF